MVRLVLGNLRVRHDAIAIPNSEMPPPPPQPQPTPPPRTPNPRTLSCGWSMTSDMTSREISV
eukprot:scaffold8269_cov122-Isochrysis_galbana.AAC.3